jgi:hypothetical protein
MATNRSNIRRTKSLRTGKKSQAKNVKDGYSWLFGESALTDSFNPELEEKKTAAAKRRQDGYEWLFS